MKPPDLTNAQVVGTERVSGPTLALARVAWANSNGCKSNTIAIPITARNCCGIRRKPKKRHNVWTRRSRNQRFERYWRNDDRAQICGGNDWSFTFRAASKRRPEEFRSKTALTEYYEQLLSQLRAEFEHVHEMLAEIFAGQGARIIPMKDADHYRHYTTFLNPSLADRFDYDPIDGFDPQLSIQENCWHSEGNGQADFGFFMDGRYHSIIVLSRWPKTTYPGIIHRLTSLRLLDYTITVNLDPLPVRREITKEEKEHDRIAGDYASEKKLSLLTVMEKKQKKIAALMQGHTIPFHVLFAVRAWDKSKEGLIAKTTAIKNAINGMNSAQYSESTLPSTSKTIVFRDLAGLDMGQLQRAKTLRRKPLHRRHAADCLDVHRPPRLGRGDLRRPEPKSRRHQNFLRFGGQPIAATRRFAGHERRRKIRHHLRPAFADRRLFRLHRHH